LKHTISLAEMTGFTHCRCVLARWACHICTMPNFSSKIARQGCNESIPTQQKQTPPTRNDCDGRRPEVPEARERCARSSSPHMETVNFARPVLGCLKENFLSSTRSVVLRLQDSTTKCHILKEKLKQCTPSAEIGIINYPVCRLQQSPRDAPAAQQKRFKMSSSSLT
jgi:hypothetical protein